MGTGCAEKTFWEEVFLLSFYHRAQSFRFAVRCRLRGSQKSSNLFSTPRSFFHFFAAAGGSF
jgi:hypothetical protein